MLADALVLKKLLISSFRILTMTQRSIKSFFSPKSSTAHDDSQGKDSDVGLASPVLMQDSEDGHHEQLDSDSDTDSGNANAITVTSSSTPDTDKISSGDPCGCLCCQNFEIPHQPTAVELKKSKTLSSGGQSRSIQISWFIEHKWISVCTSSYKIFCHICCNAKSQNLIRSSSHSNSAFVDVGYSNCKRALDRFARHEKSEMHQEAIIALADKSSKVNISDQLCNNHAIETEKNRAMFLMVLECIRFLARQGLAFRGHYEDSIALQGNLYQLLLLQAKHNEQLASWIKRRDYISPLIVNEVINICGKTILRQLLQEIYDAEWFSLIADEATDVSHNEQMCIAIRWVDSSYSIFEAALGLVQLPDTKALTIFGFIKDVLVRCSLPITQCIGQAYDGASNMSGIRNGVQALMKKESDHCLYVHCFAHSLNLCIQEVTRKCELLRNCLEFISQLVQLIRFSPKRLNLFETIHKSVTISENESAMSPSLRPLCPTRWTVRHSAINSILKNYKNLMSSLEIIQQGHDEYAAKGKGLCTQMESFDIFFGLKLAYFIFAAAEQFSTNLQAKDTTIAKGIRGANLLKSHYLSKRTDEAFSAFYQSVLNESDGLTDEPVLPRYRRIPRRIDDGASPHRYTTPEERYRHAYYESLDQACGELEKRFDQSDIKIICDMESLLLQSANGELVVPEVSEDLVRCFRGKIDVTRLKVQLPMLPSAINTAFASTSTRVNKVTNVRTIANTLYESKLVKDMLSEVDKLIRHTQSQVQQLNARFLLYALSKPT